MLEQILLFLLNPKLFEKCYPRKKYKQSQAYRTTPLHVAAKEDLHEIAQQLLEIEVDFDINARNESYMTALSIAVSRGHDRTMKVLTKHQRIDVNLRNGYTAYIRGDTPLMMAVYARRVEMIKTLLERRDIDVNTLDRSLGWTPLSLARNGTEEMANLFNDHISRKIHKERALGTMGRMLRRWS